PSDHDESEYHRSPGKGPPAVSPVYLQRLQTPYPVDVSAVRAVQSTSRLQLQFPALISRTSLPNNKGNARQSALPAGLFHERVIR
ncbi:MAG: hypothetical protein AAGJ28_23250, partial [Pseudomonadota bacterium]